MYTRIVDVERDALLVREMHQEASGIRIFRAGDRIQLLNPKSLIPFSERIIRDVEYINSRSFLFES